MLAYCLMIVGLATLMIAGFQAFGKLRLKQELRKATGRIVDWRERHDILEDNRQLNTFYYNKVIQFRDFSWARGCV